MSRCRQCGWPFDIGSDNLCKNCKKLKEHPDATSKRKTLKGVPFKDMKQMDEAQRFLMIADMLQSNRGKEIAVMVDTGEGYADKGDRYIKAIRELLPEVQLVRRFPGPVAGVESIVFKLWTSETLN